MLAGIFTVGEENGTIGQFCLVGLHASKAADIKI